MTLTERTNHIKEKVNLIFGIIKPIILTILFIILLNHVESIKKDVYSGIKWIVSCLIPTLFPFTILTQLLSTINFKFPFSRLVCHILGIDEELLVPLVLGMICGFPIGAILTREIYKNGSITKEEAERVIILSSQPSIAFLIGIGATAFPGAHRERLLIPLIVIMVVLFLLLSRKSNRETQFSSVIVRQSMSISKCIMLSGEAMINLSFFVTTFFAVSSVIKLTIKNQVLVALILPFIELSNSITYISSIDISESLKIFTLALSIGFSGLSVFLQIKSILKETGLSIKKYIPLKLLEGIVLALMMVLLK